MTAKDQALAATDALIAELESELEAARDARRKLSGEPEPPSRDELEGDAPAGKPEAIIRILQLSTMDALSPNAIFGALDTRGWITEADRHDDKHFHKSLQRLYERGVVYRPRRGMYALTEGQPNRPVQDPALGNGSLPQEVILEES